MTNEVETSNQPLQREDNGSGREGEGEGDRARE